jgi:hypothetical protein
VSSSSSRTLTAREQAVWDFVRRGRVSDVLAALAAAALGELACALVQFPCFELPSEAGGRPIEGTPAASYCTRIDHGYRWLAFPALALLIAAFARVTWRGHRYSRRLALGLVALAVIVNTVVVYSLPEVPNI